MSDSHPSRSPSLAPRASPSISNCPVCSCNRRELFQALLLGKHQVHYFFCDSCGLLQTEEPYWLDEAYSRAIADADTGLVSRNLDIARRLSGLLYFCFAPTAAYLDYAGGYGLLTRLMRDRGFDFCWHDPFCENVLARGFEWNRSREGTTAGAVTAFEVIEHVQDPALFVREALKVGNSRTIIFTTLLYEGAPPRPEKWWYYALESGQHISFFHRRTLTALASKLNLRLYTNGSFHVLTDRKMNSVAFRILSTWAAPLADLYVKRRMKSKTFDDHQKLAGGS